MQLAQFDMKVDLRMEEGGMAHGRSQYGQHDIDIPAFFSPEGNSTTGVVVA